MASKTRAERKKARLWLVVAFGLGLALLSWTAFPIFVQPQLEPDDYRYLQQVRNLEADFQRNILAASIVENRWDHLWYLKPSDKVRFFRPTVVLSYWLDTKLWGWDSAAAGLLFTNLLVHALCVGIGTWLLYRWLGAGLPLVLSAALFASFFCHGEVIWYVAGRTDSLAALGFLLALAFHVEGTRRRWLRSLALPCFGFAFLTKELTLALPLLCFLHDLWLGPRGRGAKQILKDEWGLWVSYAGLFLGIQGLRLWALAGSSRGLVFPYFVSPASPDFVPHLWTQLRSYSENLLLAGGTPPFLQPGELSQWSSTFGLLLSVAVLAAVGVSLSSDRLFWFLVSFAVLTWLPTSVVYVSERYIYLPSFAVAASAGLLLQRLRGRGPVYVVVAMLAVTWTGHQAYKLNEKHRVVAQQMRREPLVMQEQLRNLRPPVPRGAKLLLLNLPGSFVQAQFAEAQLQVLLDDPSLSARVLTLMPATTYMGAGMRIQRTGPRSFRIRGLKRGDRIDPVLSPGRVPFARVPFETGRTYGSSELGFEVDVLSSSAEGFTGLAFRFEEPLETYTILMWEPGVPPQSGGSPEFNSLFGRMYSRLRVVAPR